MLSEARAKLEAFSAKFPNGTKMLMSHTYNEGTSYLNNLNFELTKNKMCKSFLANGRLEEEAVEADINRSLTDNKLITAALADYTCSKF